MNDYTAAIIGLVALAACTFIDPNAPPPQDPCIAGPPEAEGRYWALIDGPAPCSDPASPDTITHFTGGAWNASSALCRAKDVYLNETTKPMNADTLTLVHGLRVPPQALGYCIVNAGTPSEVISYSVCGLASAAGPICDLTLPQLATSEITAKWFDCPGGSECPKVSDPGDACIKLGGSDGDHSFALFVDYPFYVCDPDLDKGDGGTPQLALEDTRDTQFLSLGPLFGWQSAACMATAALDVGGALQYGVSSALRDEPAPRTTSGRRSGKPPLMRSAPEGATGYCLYSQDDQPYQFAMYSLCDSIFTSDARIADTIASEPVGRFSREQICKEGYPSLAHPRKGVWYPCPGNELCY